MTQKIQELKRNIALQKSIEKQLAKRAYKGQKQIDALKWQVQSLERKKNAHGKLRLGKDTKGLDKSKCELEGEELIDFLEIKLEEIEQRWRESQVSRDLIQNNCADINEKLYRSSKKYKSAALLLTELL